MKYNKLQEKYFEDERVVNSGIIIFNKDKILLVERKDKKHWELPGGKVKLIDQGKTKKETLKKAAIREVFEEVNLKPKVLDNHSAFYIDFETPDKIKRRSYNLLQYQVKNQR
jgi:ADP-ribose pyrophosphatase YjhB (NUDIX family)